MQFSSKIIHQFKPENLFDSIQIGITNQSLNKGGVKIKCHKCFSMKYGHHLRKLYSVDDLIDGGFH